MVLAALQLAAPALFSLSGSTALDADRSGEPPIVPAGYAFAIWGLVVVLAAGYAVWALATYRPGVRDRLAGPLAVVFAGFSAWLAAVAVEPVWTPLVIFVVMVAALLRALAVAMAGRAEIDGWSRSGRGLLWGTLGVYTGWSSIAVWVNLTTALAGSGAPVEGPVGVAAQLAVLAGAVGTAVVVVRWTRGLLPYSAAVLWALVGAALGAWGAGEPLLAAAAAAGVLVVATLTIAARPGGRSRAPRAA